MTYYQDCDSRLEDLIIGKITDDVEKDIGRDEKRSAWSKSMVYDAVGTMNRVLVEDSSVSGNRTPGDKVLKRYLRLESKRQERETHGPRSHRLHTPSRA